MSSYSPNKSNPKPKKRAPGFVAKITVNSGPGGIAIVGFNPPKK